MWTESVEDPGRETQVYPNFYLQQFPTCAVNLALTYMRPFPLLADFNHVPLSKNFSPYHQKGKTGEMESRYW